MRGKNMGYIADVTTVVNALMEQILSMLTYLRYGPMEVFYESLFWKIPFYGALAYDGISHFPQIRKNLTAEPGALYQAVAPSPLVFNAGLGVVILFAAVYFVDPLLILNGILLCVVYGFSLSILLKRRKKPEDDI